jgi:hypothetical protein
MGRICCNGTKKVKEILLFVVTVTGSIPFQANTGKDSTCSTQRKKTKREEKDMDVSSVGYLMGQVQFPRLQKTRSSLFTILVPRGQKTKRQISITLHGERGGDIDIYIVLSSLYL